MQVNLLGTRELAALVWQDILADSSRRSSKKFRDSDATLSIASTHYLIRDVLPRMEAGGGLEMFPPVPFTGPRWSRPFW